MAKIPRTHIEGAVYYVTSRGDNEEVIFKDNEDYQRYLELLKKYKEQYGFKLFAFVLMPNHLHLLIELKEGLTISDIMHDLNSNYTKYFNGKYERKGHLFQERYKLVLLEKESYLLPVSSYIYLNPLKLGLINEISEYPYSSYLYYIGKGKELDLAEEIKVIRQKLGMRSYEELLRGVSKEEMEALGKDLAKEQIMGSGEFRKKVEELTEELKSLKTEKPKRVNKKFVLTGAVAILILGVFNFYLYGKTLDLKKNFKQALEKKEVELNTQITQEKQKAYKDLEEKYQADRVSYEAMAKRLELEKQKIKKLEGKVDGHGQPAK